MLCGEAAWSDARSRCKGPRAERLAGWVAASQPASQPAWLLVHSGPCGAAAADEVASCLPGGEDRRPGWLEAEAWHTGTYLDVNIFSGESSWELGPHRERASPRKPRVRARWVPPKLHHHPPEAVRQGGEARLCTGCWEPGEQAWVPACPWLDSLPSLSYSRLHLLPWL